jgi:hypothetical protein
MFQVEVFWVVAMCSVAVGYRHFGGSCCVHLQVEMLVTQPRRPRLEIVTIQMELSRQEEENREEEWRSKK